MNEKTRNRLKRIDNALNNIKSIKPNSIEEWIAKEFVIQHYINQRIYARLGYLENPDTLSERINENMEDELFSFGEDAIKQELEQDIADTKHEYEKGRAIEEFLESKVDMNFVEPIMTIYGWTI